MTLKKVDLKKLAADVESFAALVAGADEGTPGLADSAAGTLSEIARNPYAPETIVSFAREAAATAEAFGNGECGFEEFYDEMCGWAEMFCSELKNIPAEEEATPEAHFPAAAEAVAGSPTTGAELSPESAEEFEMQLEVLESLADSFTENNIHMIPAMVNILGKISAIPGAGSRVRKEADSCAESLKTAESGRVDFSSAREIFESCLCIMREEFSARRPAAASSAGPAAPKGEIALENQSEKCLALLEEFESAVLDAEGGDSGAVSRIRAAAAELVKSAGAEPHPLASSLIESLSAITQPPSFSPGTDEFGALLAAKDVLNEYFRTKALGGRGAISMEQVDEILSVLKISRPVPAPPRAKCWAGPLPDVDIPSVDIDPANPELNEFVAETQEYIQSAEAALIVLENDPGSAEHLNEIFRCFHNIKGISGFLGLKDVQMLAHEAESLMDNARNGKIRFAGIYATLAYEALDTLREMIGAVKDAIGGAKYGAPEGFAAVVSRLRNPEAAERQTGVSAAAPGPETPGDAPAADGNGKAHAVSHETMVKLSTSRLDSLIDMVGELVIANAMVSQDQKRRARERRDREMAQRISHLEKITRELQEMAMSLRMVSLHGAFQKLTRVARDTSHKAGVPVEFTVSGGDTEIDRNMVEEITSPLVHMVRNAIDHGIERPEERKRAGKPEKGKVHLSAFHESGNVVIRIEDDGRGLDRENIYRKAESMGLIRPGADMEDGEVYSLIFHPGFSTAREVTDISGRGVGMDVVKRTIENLRGRIEIKTETGKGSSFTIRLPLTLAIIDGMVVSIGGESYIIPTIAIQESLRPGESQLSTVTKRGEMILLRNNLIPLFRLHRLFEIEGAKTDPREAMAIVVGENGSRCALMVDNLLGQQQVVIKSLGKMFSGVDGISGGAIMGDGRVALILDTPGLVRLATGAAAG